MHSPSRFPPPPSQTLAKSQPLKPVFSAIDCKSCIEMPNAAQNNLIQAPTQIPTQAPAQVSAQNPIQASDESTAWQKMLRSVIQSSPSLFNSFGMSTSSTLEQNDQIPENHQNYESHRPRSNAYFQYSHNRTRSPFKAQKSGRGTSSWQLKEFAEATLGSGSLKKAVKLPEGEDENEWLAVNVVDFYNQINLLYGAITEFCSPLSCPEMKATDEFEYLWQDSENYKKPTKMTAPEYVEHLMSWVQSNVDNEQLFPSRIGVPFPKGFKPLVLQMFKRLFRVYAHIYCHHYPVVINLGLEPHLNTSFKHFVLFVDEHKLNAGSRDFWGPMGDVVESLLKAE